MSKNIRRYRTTANNEIPEDVRKAFTDGRIVFVAWVDETTGTLHTINNEAYIPEDMQIECADAVVEALMGAMTNCSDVKVVSADEIASALSQQTVDECIEYGLCTIVNGFITPTALGEATEDWHEFVERKKMS